jgi:CelD/BcsL family acetyltransferase involved in cellulose biosynthesis
MRAEIYLADEVPSQLREAWRRLAADDPTAGPEWRDAWWDAYGDGLERAIGVVCRGDEVIAVAAWYVDHKPLLGCSLSAMGDGKACTDYQRVLLDSSLGEVEVAAAVETLVDAYQNEPATARVSAWTLEGIEPADPSIGTVLACLAKRNFELTEEPLESSWVLELPRNWADFTAGVQRSLRRKINKATRRVEQGEVRFEVATNWPAIDAAWDDFVRLHSLRFRDRDVAGGCFADPRFNAFLRGAVRNLADRKVAELIWCRTDNAVISMQLYILGGGTASMYQSGIDPAQMQLEPGHLLFTHVVRRLIERGYRRLDFLRGDESYKADWGAKARPLIRLTAVSPRTTARLRYGAWRKLRDLKRRFASKRAGTPQPRNTSPAIDARIPQPTNDADETVLLANGS